MRFSPYDFVPLVSKNGINCIPFTNNSTLWIPYDCLCIQPMQASKCEPKFTFLGIFPVYILDIVQVESPKQALKFPNFMPLRIFHASECCYFSLFILFISNNFHLSRPNSNAASPLSHSSSPSWYWSFSLLWHIFHKLYDTYYYKVCLVLFYINRF